MPGVIGALAESGTPFSILTKGTLLRRDIPLLAAAARDVPVGLGVSMAIWDDDLHPALEPGVPTPRARLDLVATLTDAGLPCGVFLARCCPASPTAPPTGRRTRGDRRRRRHRRHRHPAAPAARCPGVVHGLAGRGAPRARPALRAALRPPRLRARRVPHLAAAAGRAAAGQARAGPPVRGSARGSTKRSRRGSPATRRSASRRGACRPPACPVRGPRANPPGRAPAPSRASGAAGP